MIRNGHTGTRVRIRLNGQRTASSDGVLTSAYDAERGNGGKIVGRVGKLYAVQLDKPNIGVMMVRAKDLEREPAEARGE